MPITEKSDENIRAKVLEYLAGKKRDNPLYRVLDVGGGSNPWCDKYVDAYVDINAFPTEKKLYLGDINRQPVWDAVAREKFDFSICTHTLEDIRNPEFVIEKLISLTGAGFIAMPNKHTEMSCLASVYWTGYFHHRWIFSISDSGSLRIFPKFPVAGYFSSANWLPHFLHRLNSGLVYALMNKIKRAPVAPGIAWIKKEKILPGKELGFMWEGAFEHEFVNGDYAGPNASECARLYTEELKSGL